MTNDDDLAAKIRLMKNFGFCGYDNVDYIGTNGKMTEIAAAMGLTNLESLDEFVAANRRNHLQYAEEFASIPGIRLIRYPEGEKCNYQYVVVEFDENRTGISRDDLIQALHAENVLARRYFYPGCHMMQPYRAFFPHAGLLLPETERIARQVVVLPTGTTVSADDIHKICGTIRFVCEHGPEVAQALHAAMAEHA